MHRIIIVGGGAGGLELATRVGDTLGRSGQAEVTLVDQTQTHMWKPLLHEVAAGSMDVHAHQLDYAAQARWHHFTFCHGALESLARQAKTIAVSPIHDATGLQVIPRRVLPYDTLVIAIGAVSNTFNTPGVAEHAIGLESAADADRFHQRLINACLHANYRPGADRSSRLNVVIVGGGATGVELAAELHDTTRVLAAYGLANIDRDRYVQITLVNADARLLTMLPERVANAAEDVLRGFGVTVLGSEQVIEVSAGAVRTKSGKQLPADLVVWAAGIKGPPLMKTLDGLETNRGDQLLVLPTLQTTLDADIFAMGDCASCPRLGHERPVPATAQAAHQQGAHLLRTLRGRLRGEAPRPFAYRDFGTLVSLGEFSTVGSLMGVISGKSMRVEGLFARFMYLTLYKQHLYALHGFLGVLMDTLARLLKRGTEPAVKLH